MKESTTVGIDLAKSVFTVCESIGRRLIVIVVADRVCAQRLLGVRRRNQFQYDRNLRAVSLRGSWPPTVRSGTAASGVRPHVALQAHERDIPVERGLDQQRHSTNRGNAPRYLRTPSASKETIGALHRRE